MSYSKTPLITLALASAAITPVMANEIDCDDRYSGNSHMLEVCRCFIGQNVQVIKASNERYLNDIVKGESDENTLFIVDQETIQQDAPVKLKGRQSILPGNFESHFELKPVSQYSTAYDPVFCQVLLGDGGTLGGLKSDASTFAGNRDFTLSRQMPNKPVTLVYTKGISQFQIINANLKGEQDMDYVIWADNDVGRSHVEGNTYHTIAHSYIEGNGARNTVSLELPVVEDSSRKEKVSVKNNIITTGDDYLSEEPQKALNIENGCGEVMDNHLSFTEGSDLEGTQIRHLLFMKDVDGTTVSNTVFHSQELQFREADQLLHLHETSAGKLTVHLINNLGTEQATEVSGNVKHVYGSFTNNLIPVESAREEESMTDDEFWSGNDLISAEGFFNRSALAGVRLVDRYADQLDVLLGVQKPWSSNITFVEPVMECPTHCMADLLKNTTMIATINLVSYVFNGIQLLFNVGATVIASGLMYKIHSLNQGKEVYHRLREENL